MFDSGEQSVKKVSLCTGLSKYHAMKTDGIVEV